MFTLIAALAAVSAAAVAQPAGITYLQCDATYQGEPVQYTITLNEPEASANWTSSRYPSWRRDPVRFAPDAAYFMGFKINRADLSMTRAVPSVLDESVAYETGRCHKTAPPPNRAF